MASNAQHTQTDQQVAAILSMPPNVLVQLARTPDQAQQQQIAVDSQLDPAYLSIMRLDAPSGNSLELPIDQLGSSVAVISRAEGAGLPGAVNISHPAIPHILHQVFSPNSAVILAPVNQSNQNSLHSHEYQPTYRSVDDWAMQVAQLAIPSIDRDATNYVASQLKLWALHSQDTQLQQHVQEAKANAVLLAAKAQAVVQTVQSQPGYPLPPQISQEAFNSPDFFPDLTPYANTYKSQLASMASGYYTKLHQDALVQLNLHPAQQAAFQSRSNPTGFGSSQHSSVPSRHHPSPSLDPHQALQSPDLLSHQALAPNTEKLTTQNVQAAAVAALTANVMAATEIASRAGQALSTLGMNIQTNLTSPLPPPGPTAIAATQHSLSIVQQRPYHSPSISTGPTSLDVPTDGPPILSNPTTYSLSQITISTPSQRPVSSLPHHLRHPHSSSNVTQPSFRTPFNHTLSSATLPPIPLSQQQRQQPQSHPQHLQPQPSNRPPPVTRVFTPHVEKLWKSAQGGECTERARDYLLSYAHAAYSKKPNEGSGLLPLLHTLLNHHPNHLPSLLLLSCVYYSQGDYASSLLYNNQILSIDAEYVRVWFLLFLASICLFFTHLFFLTFSATRSSCPLHIVYHQHINSLAPI